MTYSANKALSGREPIQVVEIDQDFCSLTYGVAPCTASLGVTGSVKCYNTRKTCQDPANYTGGSNTKTYRFVTSRAGLPPGIEWIPCIESIDITPSEIVPQEGLGRRAQVTVTLIDPVYPDTIFTTDKYTADRSSAAQGTYLGRWLARNPFYTGRTLRIKTGFVDSSGTFDLSADTVTREYRIDRIEGPDRRGRIMIVAKDPLKALDGDRAQCPVPSEGKLSSGITAGATSLTLDDHGADYGSSGYVRINDEIIQFSGRSGDQLTGLTRAQWGTTADSHDADDLVQLCKEWESVNVVDIVDELLTTFAGLSSSLIPSTSWDDEKEVWLSSHNLTTIISEPEPVKDLVQELANQCLFSMWWNEQDQQIELKSIVPDNLNVNTVDLDDDDHFLEDTVEAKQKGDDRISRVFVRYGLRDYTEDLKADNLSFGYLQVEADAESAEQFNEKATRVIKSRWFDENNTAQAIQLAGRLIARYRDIPYRVKFHLDAKDSDVKTGDSKVIQTRRIQDVDGTTKSIRVQILSSEERDDHQRYTAMSQGFQGRYWFIAPDGTPDYSSATEDEKESYGFISPNSGEFANGDSAYKII